MKNLIFLDSYSYETEIAALIDDLKISSERMLKAGCRLIRIKEHEEHGNFLMPLKKLG